MIQSRTIINVADNSGAKKISCIQVKGTSKNGIGRIGDTIVASIKELKPNTTKLKRGEICKAVIIATKKKNKTFRRDYCFIWRKPCGAYK